jgi:hypothetical protein
MKIDETEIGLLAYQMWEKAGHPSGQDLKFWLEAENQLRALAKAAPAPPRPQLPRADSKQDTRSPSVQLVPSQPTNGSAAARKTVRA